MTNTYNVGTILSHECQDLIANRDQTLKPKLIVFGLFTGIGLLEKILATEIIQLWLYLVLVFSFCNMWFYKVNTFSTINMVYVYKNIF